MVSELQEVVGGTNVTMPENNAENAKAIKQWKQRNAKAEFVLKRSISPALFEHIIHYNLACEIWQTLDKLFNKKDMAHLQLLENELETTTQGGMSIAQYFHLCSEISLLELDESISEARMKPHIIRGLKPEYTPFITSIQGWTQQPSLEEFKIEMLTTTNFKQWKEEIDFTLAMGEIDLALRENEPVKPITESSAESSTEQKEQYAKWDRSNLLSLLTIRRTIPNYLKSGLRSNVNAKAYLVAVEQRYFASDKVEARTLMNRLTNMKHNHVGSVREYILNMVHIQTKLRSLKLEISDDFILHLALNTLPLDFSQIKIAYKTQN
ncbi:hypothetical protein GH714_031272 [Hevea brasiliensis]|uniref:Uncharacterized protein n=1 Tax=Hevea brasiliensis TaxID=3981 RepID=A0A6A6N9G7_HEVBR|nr:hypothetical protein GH714_031272 [Hevea brasiliensis]